jgi:hypothetical protein
MGPNSIQFVSLYKRSLHRHPWGKPSEGTAKGSHLKPGKRPQKKHILKTP